MGAVDGSGGPHVFVADLEAPVLADDDRHHLRRVLRLRDGDALTVSDGAGRWRPARFGDELVLDGAIEIDPLATPTLTIGFALVKGERPELVVQKLTELGIDRIAPFVAARSVVRWDDERSAKHVDRLRRVAREAAMQCRRCRVPEVLEVASFADLIAGDGAHGDGIVLADRGGAAPARSMTTVLVGPEGGWSPEERSQAAEVGAGRVAFGDHVLRAETAALTVAAVLAAMRSGLIAERRPRSC